MDTGDDTAASRLRTLAEHYIEPVRTGPAGRGVSSPEGRAPLNLGIINHMAACRAEVLEHAERDAPDAEPAPTLPDGIYAWWRNNTRHLDAEKRQARETVIYRQALEHAIAMGDYKVIRRHPCPACGCWGLFWRATARRAACSNLDCLDADGMTSTWGLSRLAHEHITRQKNAAERATV
ncbi:hypothetical protein [Streptomyces hebeiensis]